MSELPEKIIVSNGCHDCPFEGKRPSTWVCLLSDDIEIDQCGLNRQRHHECPLLPYAIKVIKND